MRVCVTGVRVTLPSEVELELGRQYAQLAHRFESTVRLRWLDVFAGKRPRPLDAPLEDQLAHAFAMHRQRCTEQVAAILYSVEMDCLTDEALDKLDTDGSTYTLADHYRTLRKSVDEAAKLIPQVLSGARAR